jgi:hypothetical protein
VKAFRAEYDADGGTWKGISLEEHDDSKESYEQTRRLLTTAVLEQSKVNFNPLLESPIFKASYVLEHRSWPPVEERDALLDFGNAEILILINQFRDLKIMDGFDEKEAMIQWERLKFELQQHGFFKTTTFVGFWGHVATHFDTGNLIGYSEFIKIAKVVVLIVSDTSCCERVYSLMNRLHTYLRNGLGVEKLNDLICICSNGPDLKDFDPKPALKVWRESEKRGRNTSIINRKLQSPHESFGK